MKRLAIAMAMLIGSTLAGCAAPSATAPGVGRASVAYSTVGLERVLGQNAGGLVALFGQPDADVREQTARKLQFQGPICVLDAYLYPKGGREPVVTYLDAREPDGSTIDRASCVAALVRRGGGR
jgi:hypothetical protein